MRIIQLTGDEPLDQILSRLRELGLWTTKLEDSSGSHQLVVLEHSASVPRAVLLAIPGIQDVLDRTSSHPLVDAQPELLSIQGVPIGQEPVLMAGPCSVESEEQILESARMAFEAGATFLRGGCFKPRTDPYSFQGHGARALPWMREAADAYGLHVVTEAMAPEQVELVARHADMFQIGTRNMQNYDLLRAVGSVNMPVLLKRGLSSTIEEWLSAGEHLLHAGASAVIFCERGIRSFDRSTRFLLDLGAVSLLREVHGLPVIVDPSHAAGRKDLIPRLGAAALAAGACGLIVESHPSPGEACSDASQQLDEQELRQVATYWGFPPRSKRKAPVAPRVA